MRSRRAARFADIRCTLRSQASGVIDETQYDEIDETDGEDDPAEETKH